MAIVAVQRAVIVVAVETVVAEEATRFVTVFIPSNSVDDSTNRKL